jgi:SAM-dependent methyltransferase
MRINIEVEQFKLPGLLTLIGDWRPRTVLELGCATGELIAQFPVVEGGNRTGVDISVRNIEIAKERFPGVSFHAGDFRDLKLDVVDAVILSDILEHVPDDTAFLKAAASFGQRILINLPLECNWLNRNRQYGVQDASGHLRAYTLKQGLELIERAGLHIEHWQETWFHETQAEHSLRALRKQHFGYAYAGGAEGRLIRQVIYWLGSKFKPFGRRMFSSNLFVVAKNL